MDELSKDEATAAPGSSIIKFEAAEFPWWFVLIILIIGYMGFLVATNADYREAFENVLPWPLIEEVDVPALEGETSPPIDPVTGEVQTERQLVLFRGIGLTLIITAGAFIASMALGLLLGLGRISGRVPGRNQFVRFLQGVARNLSTLYIELVRGIPMIVFIFAVALVLAPDFAGLLGLEPRAISNAWRGAAALSLFYAAFIAEVFRAGIQSVHVGQVEAGRAVGLREGQIMRSIVLPQAVRNMLPALGNDLISLMKDSSLVSVLAVREVTQMARLYTGSSFRFREGFFVLMILYVTLTLALSLLLRWYERRIAIPGR